MKFLQTPLAKTVITFVVLTIALNLARPYLAKLPVVGRLI
jgi:hypothetical protein